MKSSLRANIRKMYLFQFFQGMHLFGGVLIPFFTDWGHLNFTQILLLQSWFTFWIFALEVPTGALADYLGRRYTLVAASLVNIIAILVYVSAPSFFVFMAGEFLWAMAASLISGSEHAMIYDTLKKIGQSKESKSIFGKYESAHLSGIVIGSPLGSLVASAYGLTAPMLFNIIPFAVAMLIGITLKEPSIVSRKTKKNYRKILTEGVNYFRRHRILKILALDMISISTIAYFWIWLNQAMLKQAGVDIIYFGFVHAAFVISQIVILNKYEYFESILGSKRRFLFFSAFATGIMLILGGLTNYVPLIVLSIIVGGGFGLARKPLFISYMNKYIPSTKRATVLSTVSMFRMLAIAVVNPIIGMAVDVSLSYTLIALGILAIVFSLVSKVEENHLID